MAVFYGDTLVAGVGGANIVYLSRGEYLRRKAAGLLKSDEYYATPSVATKDISGAVVSLDPAGYSESSTGTWAYNCRPAVAVTLGGKALSPGTDYQVSYSANSAGTMTATGTVAASATVTGAGDYFGTVSKGYAISYTRTDVPGLPYEKSTSGTDTLTLPAGRYVVQGCGGAGGGAAWYDYASSADRAVVATGGSAPYLSGAFELTAETALSITVGEAPLRPAGVTSVANDGHPGGPSRLKCSGVDLILPPGNAGRAANDSSNHPGAAFAVDSAWSQISAKTGVTPLARFSGVAGESDRCDLYYANEFSLSADGGTAAYGSGGAACDMRVFRNMGESFAQVESWSAGSSSACGCIRIDQAD